MRTIIRSLVAVAASCLGTLVIIQPAAAHTVESVGDHEFAVGFGTEPAYAGFPNSAQVLISHADGAPVKSIDGTLKLEVEFGDQTTELKLEPNAGAPGDYRAWFIPTRPGEYIFHLFGRMEGERVDETFTSGPDTFSEVANPTSEGFPEGDPTTGELAERLNREVARTDDRIAAAEEAAATSKEAASSSRALAIAGIVVGAIGLVVGGAGLAAARRAGAASR